MSEIKLSKISSRAPKGVDKDATKAKTKLLVDEIKVLQDVLIASFMAAYTGKDANKISLNRFPKVPIPNWRLSYNGLTKYSFFNCGIKSDALTIGPITSFGKKDKNNK